MFGQSLVRSSFIPYMNTASLALEIETLKVIGTIGISYPFLFCGSRFEIQYALGTEIFITPGSVTFIFPCVLLGPLQESGWLGGDIQAGVVGDQTSQAQRLTIFYETPLDKRDGVSLFENIIDDPR